MEAVVVAVVSFAVTVIEFSWFKRKVCVLGFPDLALFSLEGVFVHGVEKTLREPRRWTV